MKTGETTPRVSASQTLDEREEVLVLEQIKYLQNELCSIQSAFLPMISVALGAYGLLIYYAISREGTWLFVVLPFLFSLSFYNLLKYTAKMMGLDAYVSYLESLLNETHQKTLFRWQSYLIYANGFSVGGTVLQLPCYLAIFIFVIYEFIISMQTLNLSSPLAGLIWMLFIIQIFSLLCMSLLAATQYGCVRKQCRTIPLSFEGAQPDSFRTELPQIFQRRREKRRRVYEERPGGPPPPPGIGKLYRWIQKQLDLGADNDSDNGR